MVGKMDTIGRLIVFEGPDGVGKSSLSIALRNYFVSKAVPCELLSFPGREDGTLGNLVYQVHHHKERFGIKSIDATSLQLLHIAAHIDCIEKQIMPALGMGKQVILDRYWWSTLVYGKFSNANQKSIEGMVEVEKGHWRDIVPYIVFLIRRIPPDGVGGNKPPLISGYEEIAAVEKNRYAVATLDNNAGIEECSAKIVARIDEIQK
jgi:dTMP kinase